MFKSPFLTQRSFQDTLMGVLKEVLSHEDYNVWHKLDIQIYQDASYPKLVIAVRGNFKTVEEIMEEHWANNVY